MKNLKISILELGERDNKNSQKSVLDIIDYACMSEQFGYNRFWLAEHHGNESVLPYTSPEILLTIIAGNTEKIRVGSAGSVVNYYSPYSLVTKYKFLNNLFNDRIDFGLSKGHNINNIKHDFLNLPKDKVHHDLFHCNIKKIYELLFNEVENLNKYEIVIPPFGGNPPKLWYLSSSYNHFDKALEFNLNYCRSLFHGEMLYDKNFDVDKLLEFQIKFKEKHNRSPEVLIAIGVWLDDKFESIEYYNYKGMQVIKTNISLLKDIIIDYCEKYKIKEFVIYDIEVNNLKKTNNLEKLSNLLTINL
jgi:alkanesulfonate monooxygenase SsuD/methylene tetrahydromethanopterin reductase-like flavin-dependent oxidoreductase (luciferase family)